MFKLSPALSGLGLMLACACSSSPTVSSTRSASFAAGSGTTTGSAATVVASTATTGAGNAANGAVASGVAANQSANVAGQVNTTSLAFSDRSSEVGLLFQHNSDGSVASSCTGTLIRTPGHNAHNIVLTAKHCIGMDTFYLGTSVGLAYPQDHNWQDAAVGMTAYPVTASYPLDSGDVDENICPHTFVDQQILVLATPAPSSINPAVINVDAPAATACEFVGFGVHESADGSLMQDLKLSFQMAIANLVPTALWQSSTAGGVPGPGDSGGPLYCGNILVGTVSCGQSHSGSPAWLQYDQAYARVDTKATAIDDLIAQYGQ